MKLSWFIIWKILTVFIFLSLSCRSQPVIQWTKAYGGAYIESCTDLKKTSDGGYIMVGQSKGISGDVTNGHGYEDVWVVKLDSAGNLQWQKSYGGTESEAGVSIEQTSDNRGYVFIATTMSSNGDVSSNHGSTDVWVVKIDNNGNIDWEKSIGGSSAEWGRKMCKTQDSGFVFVSNSIVADGDISFVHGTSGTYGDVWVVKLDKNGNIQWERSYGGSMGEIGYAINQTSDNGYIIAGSAGSVDGDLTSNYGAGDVWVLKLSTTGVIQWQKTYGGTLSESPFDIKQTADGGYVFAALTLSNDIDIQGFHPSSFSYPAKDLWVVKLNSTGTISWAKTLGGTHNEGVGSIAELSNGSFVVVSSTNSNDGDVTGYHVNTIPTVPPYDVWMISLSGTGSLQWQKAIGSSETDFGESIIALNDSNFVVGGSTLGNDFDATGNGFHAPGSNDAWVLKLGPTSDIAHTAIADEQLKIYPNPNNGVFTVSSAAAFKEGSVVVSNIIGQPILQKQLPVGRNSVEINIANQPTGCYMLRVYDENSVSTFKLLKQ